MSEYYSALNLPTFSEFGGGEVAVIKSVDELKKLVAGGSNYSEEEQAVGTWIDGRTVYRRTFAWETNPLPSNKWSYYQEADLAALNIDQYIDAHGMAYCYSASSTASGSWQPIPRVCPDALTQYSIGFGDLNPTSIGVLFGTSYTGAKIYFTIEYVKEGATT